MPSIGPMEMLIVLIIALLVLGPKRLPAAGRSLGRGINEFRAGITSKAEEPEQRGIAAAAAPVEPPPADRKEQGTEISARP